MESTRSVSASSHCNIRSDNVLQGKAGHVYSSGSGEQNRVPELQELILRGVSHLLIIQISHLYVCI